MFRPIFLLPILMLPLAVVGQSCNEACVARAAEPALLRPPLAERHGERLVITAGAQTLTFTDNRKACDAGDAKNCAIYALVANAPGSLAVEKFEFEGSDTTLIDTRSGKQTLLSGVPVFSPDGREFVVAQFSNESDNNLEVWQRRGDGAVLEWAHPFKQSWKDDPALPQTPASTPPVFRVAAWQGDRIALAVSTDDQRHHWSGTLIHDAKGWYLSAKSPPGMFATR